LVKIENAPKEYTEGKMTIVLEKNSNRDYPLEFELEVLVKDINKLLYLQSILLNKTIDERTEKSLEEQMTVVSNILDRSYPDMDVKRKDTILAKDGMNLLLEIKLCCELENREVWEAMKKQRESQLKKLSEDDESTDDKGTAQSVSEPSPVKKE